MHDHDIRLRVKVVMECGEDRIVEIDEDEVVQAVFNHCRPDYGTEDVVAYFDAKVRSPLRAMIRAYFSKKREESGYYRWNTGMEQAPGYWPHQDQITKNLDARLAEVMTAREKEDHAATRLSP